MIRPSADQNVASSNQEAKKTGTTETIAGIANGSLANQQSRGRIMTVAATRIRAGFGRQQPKPNMISNQRSCSPRADSYGGKSL